MFLSLAPLIDVTFILLIFFMLVTQFSRLVPVDASLGEISQSAPLDDLAGADSLAQSRLRLHGDGALELDGEKLPDLDGLAAALELRARAVRAEVAPGTELVLTIEADGTVGLQRLIDALAILQESDDFATRIAVPRAQQANQ